MACVSQSHNFSLKHKGLTSMCHCTGLTCNVSYMSTVTPWFSWSSFHLANRPLNRGILNTESTSTKPTHPALEL